MILDTAFEISLLSDLVRIEEENEVWRVAKNVLLTSFVLKSFLNYYPQIQKLRST